MSGIVQEKQAEKRDCPICSSKQNRLLFRQHFSEMSTGSLLKGYDVVVCQDCGVGFADDIPEQAVFDAYYYEMSKYEHQDSSGQASEYDMARFRETVSILTPFLNNRDARILEVGCATGTLLSLLKEKGYKNVLGVDPSPVCAREANRLYGIKVLTTTFAQMTFSPGSFDLLILVGVLEHVRDLGKTLSLIRDLLSSDGCVYVVVPDASLYVHGEDAPYQEFSIEHINFFGPVSLANLMLMNGFHQSFCQQSMIQPNYRTTTPVIHGIYKKNELKSPDVQFATDSQTERGLKAYIDESRRVDDRIRKIIDETYPDGRPLIVWGTGAHTLRLLATSSLAKKNIIAFVDSNPNYQGKKLNGVPIITPRELTKMSEPILISSRVFQQEIKLQIRDNLHLSNQIITLYEI